MTAPRTQNRVTYWIGRLLPWGVLCLVPWLLWRWWTNEAIARQGAADLVQTLAETDAQDPRWRWEQIDEDRPGVPDERNSWPLLERIARTPAGADPEFKNLPADQFFAVETPANRRLDRDTLRMFAFPTGAIVSPGNGGIPKRDHDLALSLYDFPQGRYPLRLTADVLSTCYPHAEAVRAAARLLEMEGELRLDENDPAGTARAIRATLHAGAMLRGEPAMLSQLVRLALRVRAARRVERLLGMTAPDDATLAALQGHLTAEATEQPFVVGLRGERAARHVLCENLRSGEASLELFRRLISQTVADPSAPAWSLRQLDGDQALLLRNMNRALAIATLPPEQQAPLWDEYDRDVRAVWAEARPAGRHALAALLLIALGRTADKAQHDRALLASACAALAAERFRRAKQRWPETLAELVPAYLPAVPVDPYSGKPLLYKHLPDGMAVYSVGKNGVDDDGVSLSPTPDDPDADLGIRLWSQAQRRLAGLPPEEAP
jgi:hypothetical protein